MAVTIFQHDESPFNEISVMHRIRLYDEIDEHHRYPLIGIVCDSGFGKTSLIQGYLIHKGMTAIWCTFESDEPSQDVIDEVCDLLDRTTDYNAIVFDNCSFAATDRVFAESIPELIKLAKGRPIFLLGRVLPSLPFAVMRAKKQYFELTHDDLSLDIYEMRQYYNDYMHLNMHDYELELLAERTKGWFISNQLIYAYLKKNRLTNLESLDLDFLSDVTDINDFFSYDFFENQSAEMQHFLLHISPLTELAPDIINSLLDIDNADRYISELSQHHGFVSHDNNKILRLHPLFKHFLYERYSQLNHQNLSAHHRLIEIYEKKRQYMNAFIHAIACNDYIASTRLMYKISDRYNVIQLLNIVDGHLEDSFPELLSSCTSMLLLRCIPERLTVQFVQPLTEAINNNCDTLHRAILQHRLGVIYFHLGNINMSYELLEKSLNSAELLGNKEVMAFNYHLLADCHLARGDFDQALRCARNALYISDRHNIPFLQLHTLEVFSRIHLAMDNIDMAKSYIDQSMELASNDSYEMFWLNADQCMIYIKQGSPDLALQYAKASAAIVADGICGWDHAYSHLMIARALVLSGQPEEAKSHLSIAYEQSEYCCWIRYEVLITLLEIETESKKTNEIKCELAEIIEANNYYWLMQRDISNNSDVKQKSSIIILKTLGDFSILCNGSSIKISRSASIRLLQLLIMNRGRFVSKDYLIDQLFPDSSISSGANNFSVSLSVLRKALDTAAGLNTTDISCILREKDRYRLNPDLVNIDAEVFESSYDKLNNSDSDDLRKWLELFTKYSKPFMQDYPYEPILENERNRLSSIQKDMALIISHLYAQNGDFNNSLQYYEYVLESDPYDENVYYEVIEMLLDARLPAKAHIYADKMIVHLEEDLGIPCSEKLRAMFDYYYKHQ